MNRRRPAVLGALLGLGILAAPLLPEAPRETELRIGEINSLSGVMAAQGTAVHEGVVYAVSEINRRGGIRGLRVKLITRDDGGRPDEAATAALDLAMRERVSALVGGYVDSIVGPVAQVAQRERVPYVASSSLDQRRSGSRRLSPATSRTASGARRRSSPRWSSSSTTTGHAWKSSSRASSSPAESRTRTRCRTSTSTSGCAAG